MSTVVVHLSTVLQHFAAILAREKIFTIAFLSEMILRAQGARKVTFLVIEQKVPFQLIVKAENRITHVALITVIVWQVLLLEVFVKIRPRVEKRKKVSNSKVCCDWQWLAVLGALIKHTQTHKPLTKRKSWPLCGRSVLWRYSGERCRAL